MDSLTRPPRSVHATIILLTDYVYTYLIQSEAFWKSPSVSDEWKQVTLQNLLVSGRVHYPSKDADWSFPFVRYPCPDIHLKILKSGLTNQLLTLCICAMWVIVCWLAFYFFLQIVVLRFHTNEIIFKLIFFKSKILFFLKEKYKELNKLINIGVMCQLFTHLICVLWPGSLPGLHLYPGSRLVEEQLSMGAHLHRCLISEHNVPKVVLVLNGVACPFHSSLKN